MYVKQKCVSYFAYCFLYTLSFRHVKNGKLTTTPPHVSNCDPRFPLTSFSFFQMPFPHPRCRVSSPYPHLLLPSPIIFVTSSQMKKVTSRRERNIIKVFFSSRAVYSNNMRSYTTFSIQLIFLSLEFRFDGCNGYKIVSLAFQSQWMW